MAGASGAWGWAAQPSCNSPCCPAPGTPLPACPPTALFYQQHIKKLLLFDAKHASPEVCFFARFQTGASGGTAEHMYFCMQT